MNNVSTYQNSCATIEVFDLFECPKEPSAQAGGLFGSKNNLFKGFSVHRNHATERRSY